MNEHYFDNIDTEEKAYWLGFLYADGYNIDLYRIGTHLALREIDHVKLFAKCVEAPVERVHTKPPYKFKAMGRIINSSGSVTLNLNSKHMAETANKKGLTPRKSLTLKFPTNDIVPVELMKHFIRGYFDGDGHIGKTTIKGIHRYRVIIVSSKDFCEGLSKFTNKELDINMTVWDKKKTNIYKNSIGGNRQTKIFCDWMYKDASIYLHRKFVIYKELCEKIKKIDERLDNTYSKYNNISFDKSRGKWTASVRINKKTKLIGRYATEMDAYNAQIQFKLFNVYAS